MGQQLEEKDAKENVTAVTEGSASLDVPVIRPLRFFKSIYFLEAVFSSFIVIVAVGIFAFSMLRYLQSVGEDELTQRARLAVSSVETSISKDLALEEHFAVVERCRSILSDTEDLRYIVVTLRDGSVLIHHNDRWSLEDDGSRWKKFERDDDVSVITESPFEPGREVMHFGHRLFYLTLPLGHVHIGMSTDRTEVI